MTDPSLADLNDYQAKDPQQALDAALATVRTYCGWHIAPSVTETVNVWSDGCTLILATRNLTAVVSVTQDGAVVPASTYTFETYGVIRGHFGRSTRVAVNFTHGYTAWPDGATSVALSLAQRSIQDNRGLVARPGNIGAFVETYGPTLTDADKAKLAPYVVTAGFA